MKYADTLNTLRFYFVENEILPTVPWILGQPVQYRVACQGMISSEDFELGGDLRLMKAGDAFN